MDARYLQLVWALDGYERSRVPLVAYGQGRFVPAGISDDPGIYLFVPIMSRALHLSLARSIDLFLGCIITISFGLGVIGVQLTTRSNAAKVFSIFVLACLALLTALTADVYTCQSCFPVAVVPWMIYLDRVNRLPRRAIILAFLMGLSAYAMNSIRMHAGTGVLLFAAVVVLGMRVRASNKWILVSAAALGFILGMVALNLAIHRRDVYLKAQDPSYVPVISHHPLWHNIYAGLGFLQNDYGIKYDDSVSAAKVTSIDQRAEYLSPEYEHVLRKAVIEFIVAHPKFVVGTLVVKLGVLLLALVAFANVGIIAAVRHPKTWPIEAAFCACLTFTGLTSILAVPRISYMLGYFAFAVLYGVTSIDYAHTRGETVTAEVESLIPRQFSFRSRPLECEGPVLLLDSAQSMSSTAERRHQPDVGSK